MQEELKSAAGEAIGSYSTFSDFEDEGFRQAYEECLRFSDEYHEACRAQGLWPADYPWPRDAMRCNTRRWEYPYLASCLRQNLAPGARVLDIGSALTFFPYLVVDCGYELVATDNDPRMATWAAPIVRELARRRGWSDRSAPTYLTQDVRRLDLGTASFDGATCVSVLEHLEAVDQEAAIREMARVVKPGGLLLLTVDCLVRGHGEPGHEPLKSGQLNDLARRCSKHFSRWRSTSLRVPGDLITNRRVPTDDPTRLAGDDGGREGLIRRLRSTISNVRRPREIFEWCALGVVLRRNDEEVG